MSRQNGSWCLCAQRISLLPNGRKRFHTYLIFLLIILIDSKKIILMPDCTMWPTLSAATRSTWAWSTWRLTPGTSLLMADFFTSEAAIFFAKLTWHYHAITDQAKYSFSIVRCSFDTFDPENVAIYFSRLKIKTREWSIGQAWIFQVSVNPKNGFFRLSLGFMNKM